MKGTPLETPSEPSVVERLARVPGAALLVAGYFIGLVRRTERL